jgi:hypothetical protein
LGRKVQIDHGKQIKMHGRIGNIHNNCLQKRRIIMGKMCLNPLYRQT